MIKITTIEVGYSENPYINKMRKYFPSYTISEIINELNEEDRERNRDRMNGKNVCYDKTDVTIFWDDGQSFSIHFAIGDGIKIEDHFDFEKSIATITKRLEKQGKLPSKSAFDWYNRAIEFMQDREKPSVV